MEFLVLIWSTMEGWKARTWTLSLECPKMFIVTTLLNISRLTLNVRNVSLADNTRSFCSILLIAKGSSINDVRSDFANLHPPPCTCTYDFSLHPPGRACGYSLLKKIWQIYFANYYQSKNHEQCNKVKKPLKATRKYRMCLRFLTVRGRREKIILAVWITLYFISVL